MNRISGRYHTYKRAEDLKRHLTKHSSSLWLEKAAKAHPFAKPSLARAQGRLECETLDDRQRHIVD